MSPVATTLLPVASQSVFVGTSAEALTCRTRPL
jgi:hypothetical protein